ncbi:hypothetical protein [Novosphingopyxis sp.]|uniref:hypothetical protein n=1 Tax=Novosphingopyxis sp. TaxID=2709690 RepID=UPI003B5AB93A
MSKIIQALIWAFLMLAMAALSRFDWIDRDMARTLLIVLPALGFIAISGRSCRLKASS